MAALPGGIARLDTTVSFGHRQAVLEQVYGRHPAARPGTARWKLAALAGLILYGLATTVLLGARRRRARTSGRRSLKMAASCDPLEPQR
jgi:hypothetical protein